MSDMPGLALVLVAQALLLLGMKSPLALVAGALAAGLGAGVRVQAAALTLPLFVAALVAARRAGIWWLISRPVAALAAGVLAWAVPLVMASGGPDGYLKALGTQAGEDFAWVDMLWANPTPRRLAMALYATFVQPWESVGMFIPVACAAVLGAAARLVRHRQALWLLAVAFGPYAVFHLLMQDTTFVRYALPLLVPVCWLAVTGADAIAHVGRRALPIGAAAAAPMVLFTAMLAVPVGRVYGGEPHPAFRAIADMDSRAATAPPAAIYSHYALRRPLQAALPAGLRIVEPRRSYEWLGLVDYWRSGGEQSVWFLADPRRTDLSLIDPQARRAVIQYRWSVGDHQVLAGTRPNAVDWYRIERPGWFASEGWSLTPEAGGITRLDGTGPDRRPIEAYVRRRADPAHMVVGGRYLGAAGGGAVTLDLRIDDVLAETWEVDPARDGLNFLRFIDLPGGALAGEGTYARLTIQRERRSRPAGCDSAVRYPGSRAARARIWRGLARGRVRQCHRPQLALDERPVGGAGGAVSSHQHPTSRRVSAQVPGLGAAGAGERGRPRARGVSAGSRLHWTVRVPADAVEAAGGAIAIETDRVYLPGAAEGTADERRLGLRLFEIVVNPASP